MTLEQRKGQVHHRSLSALCFAPFFATRSGNMSQCAMGVGAVTVTHSRAKMGVRFAWPHLHSSLGVMVPTSVQTLVFNHWVRTLGVRLALPAAAHCQSATNQFK
jgi:hypothetical protein